VPIHCFAGRNILLHVNNRSAFRWLAGFVHVRKNTTIFWGDGIAYIQNRHIFPPIMKVPNFWQMVVYDPMDEPSADEYLFYIRFEPLPGRNWTLVETQFAAEEWARKLILMDGSQFLGRLDRLQAFAKPIDESDVIKTEREFELGAGITVWIEMVPPGSRFTNEIQLRAHIMRLRGEVASQVQANRLQSPKGVQITVQ
jgi:hypothetical protein